MVPASANSLDLGRFHEISVSTQDLDASLRFYELMGFTRGSVGNIWPHPYAIVTLGGLTLGLHEYKFPSPSFTSVHDDVNAALAAYREAGAVIAFAKTGSDCFNEFGLRDPAGHMITLLERATHPDDAWNPASTSPMLGEYLAFSLPSAAPEISAGFWQALGAERADLGRRGRGLLAGAAVPADPGREAGSAVGMQQPARLQGREARE